ncbi:hypothetical protein [Sandaracinus amylolyticus]|uniref:Oxetanocin A resistance protein n=1 Tax=Sandaracinus amylolyticus TaxID=927083 RepID=A0A0F6W4Q7_9BACT|nr:hypothetical protein [Sandaracinus amylolyticus]AKF07348.1 oxetanocin A resistance protein [Sandaracinus amylolyticus]
MRRSDLVADCSACAALCCTALPFDASEEFAIDKGAGEPCRYLCTDDRCAIHDQLVVRGFSGCAAFDCYGAGPRVTRAFADAPQRDDAFRVLRELHELLWLLTEAAKLVPPTHAELRARLASEVDGIEAIACGPIDALLEVDPRGHHERAHALLRRVGDTLGGRRRALVVITRR